MSPVQYILFLAFLFMLAERIPWNLLPLIYSLSSQGTIVLFLYISYTFAFFIY